MFVSLGYIKIDKQNQQQLIVSSLSNNNLVCLQVTCPGVFLSRRDQMYLSVCILGRYRKTPCVPAVFPLHFHHRMVFSKVGLTTITGI